MSETISGLTQSTLEPEGPEEPSLFGDFSSFLGSETISGLTQLTQHLGAGGQEEPWIFGHHSPLLGSETISGLTQLVQQGALGALFEHQFLGSDTISEFTHLLPYLESGGLGGLLGQHSPLAGSETISGLTQLLPQTENEPVGPNEPSIFGDFSAALGGGPIARLIGEDLRDIAEQEFNALRDDLRQTIEHRLGLDHADTARPGTGGVNVALVLDDIRVNQLLDGNGDTAEGNFKFDADGQTWSYYKEGINERGDVLPINHTFTLDNWDPNVNLIVRTYGSEVDPTIFGVDDPLPTVSNVLTSADLYNHNFQTTARNADGSFDLVYDWTLYATPASSASAHHDVLMA